MEQSALPYKLVGERITVRFCFLDGLAVGEEAIRWTTDSSVLFGLDASPSTMLYGEATWTEATGMLSQQIEAGEPGVVYKLTTQLHTTLGNTLQRSLRLAILPVDPMVPAPAQETILVPPPIVSPPGDSIVAMGDLGNGFVGEAIDFQYTQEGGSDPCTWTLLSGAFPTGSTMDSSGRVTGTRTVAGVFGMELNVLSAEALTDDHEDESITWDIFLLAAGDNGHIVTATAPGTWTSQTSGTTEDLMSVCMGRSSHVVVGDKNSSGIILRSSDNGTTWASKTTGLTCNHIRGVATNQLDMFIAVGGSGGLSAGKATRSTDDALTWVALAIPAGIYSLNGICYISGSTWAACSSNGKVIVTNDNGSNWDVYVVAASSDALVAIAYSEELNLVMAVGDEGNTYTWTPGASSWDFKSAPFGAAGSFNGLAAIGTRFVAAAQHNVDAGAYLTVDSGVTWTYVKATFNSFCMCNINNFAYMGSSSGFVANSQDSGSTWTSNSTTTGNTIRGIAGGREL